MAKTTWMQVRIEVDLKAKAAAAAAKKDVTLSAWVRRLVKKEVARGERV